MKNHQFCTVFVACAGVLAGQAHANNVTVYGSLDTGVESISNVGANKDRLTRMPTLTGTQGSRLGFRGQEDLGGGLRAQFALESGFGVDTGTLNQGGRTFGRQAWLALAGAWGTFTVGRQYNLYLAAMADADVMGPNIYGLGSLDTYLPGSRWDNALSYRGKFGGLTVGAAYSFGRDAVADCGEQASGSGCQAVGALMKYDEPTWGMALGYDQQRGKPGVGTFTDTQQTDTRTTLAGYWKFGSGRVGAGLVRRENETNAVAPRSNLAFVGAAYEMAPNLTVDGQIGHLDIKGKGDDSTNFALRATYSLSKRTAVYTTVGYMKNRGAARLAVSGGTPGGSSPVAGISQTGVMVGLRHVF